MQCVIMATLERAEMGSVEVKMEKEMEEETLWGQIKMKAARVSAALKSE